MLKFSLFRIPITVHWLFWVVIALLGGAGYATTPTAWKFTFTFMAAAFVSILVHEFGHALTGRRFGARRPEVLLYGFGGLASFPGAFFTRRQSFLVTAAGPGAGLVFAAVCIALSVSAYGSMFPPLFRDSDPVRFILYHLVWINLVWSLLNLLPILPLDGGQLLRDALGPRQANLVKTISLVTIAVLIPVAAYYKQWFAVFMLVYLGYQNFKGQGFQRPV